MSVDSELIEIKKKIDENGVEANKSFKFAQDTLKKQDEKINTMRDSIKGLDGVTAEAVTKAAADTAKSLEEIQKLQQNAEKLRKEQLELEKIVSRSSKSGGSYNGVQDSPDIVEYRKKLCNFITHGEKVDTSIAKKGAAAAFGAFQFLEEKTRNNFVNEFSGNFNEKGNHWLPSEIVGLVQKTMLSGSLPEGGYYANTPERRTDMTIDRVFETSPIRMAGVNIISTTAKSIEVIINDDEVGDLTDHGELRGPGQEIVTSTPKIGLLTIHTASKTIHVRQTHDFLEEAVGINPEAWLSGKVNEKFDRQMNTQCFRGDGINQKTGILTKEASADRFVYERFKLPRVNSGTNGEITFDGLIRLWLQPKETYQTKAVWMVKRQAFTEIVLLKDLDNRPLINPALLAEGTPIILFGKRVIFADDLDSTLDSGGSPITGAEPIVYGDFSKGYTIVERIGVRFIRDIFSDDNKELVKFSTTKKWGGDVTNYEALAIQKLVA